MEAWLTRMFGKGSDTADEVRRNASTFFSSIAERFELVSRKEFSAQQKALTQAMKKLEQLEKQVGGKPASKSAPASKKKPTAKKTSKKKA